LHLDHKQRDILIRQDRTNYYEALLQQKEEQYFEKRRKYDDRRDERIALLDECLQDGEDKRSRVENIEDSELRAKLFADIGKMMEDCARLLEIESESY
jgi:hypothetical protein